MVLSLPAGLRTAVAGPVLTSFFVVAALGVAVPAYAGVDAIDSIAVRVALAAGAAVPIALLPRRPLVAWCLAMVATLLNLPRAVAPDGLSWPWHPSQVAVLPALVLLVALVHRGATTVGIAVLTAATMVAHLPPSRAPAVVVAVAVPALVGDQIRRRVEAQRGLVAERKLTVAERERGAVLEERARIAREMHDVVAHHMSMIAVRAETAPYRLSDERDVRDSEFVALAGASRAALQDMRRLLGVLRSDDTEAAPTPAPGLGDIPGMVTAATAAGLTVTLEAMPADPAPPLVEQAAYRIVQESLSNATRHAAGASVRVAVTAEGAALKIRVHNTAPVRPAARSSGGHGLKGMRERARALGGTLTAAPAPDGGYEVRAVLPFAVAHQT